MRVAQAAPWLAASSKSRLCTSERCCFATAARRACSLTSPPAATDPILLPQTPCCCHRHPTQLFPSRSAQFPAQSSTNGSRPRLGSTAAALPVETCTRCWDHHNWCCAVGAARRRPPCCRLYAHAPSVSLLTAAVPPACYPAPPTCPRRPGGCRRLGRRLKG